MGLGGLIRHTAAATTALVLVIVGGVTLGQLLPAGLRQYVPGTALQGAVAVNHSAGLLRPGNALVVVGVYAVIALAAVSIRIRIATPEAEGQRYSTQLLSLRWIGNRPQEGRSRT